MDIYTNEYIKQIKESILNLFTQMNNSTANALNSVSNLIKKSLNSFTSILEETFEKNKANLEKFANYGWTPWGNMPMDLFFKEINSKDEVDELCLKCIDNETLNEILKEVKETSTKNDYIKESVILFEKEFYRSCAMLIIAYMDRVISENIDLKDKSKYSKKIGKKRYRKDDKGNKKGK